MGKYRVPGAYHPDSELFTLPITAPNQLQDFRFSRAALGIYVALCSCVEDESEIVTISHNTLRKTVGCSLPTIAGVLQRLEKMGRIEVIEWEHSRANLSDRLRWRVFKRDGYKCVYCGKEDGPFEVDHVLPIDKGGRDNMKNLVTACPRCNRKKSNKVVNND